MRHIVGFLPIELSWWKKHPRYRMETVSLKKNNFHFWFSESFGHRMLT